MKTMMWFNVTLLYYDKITFNFLKKEVSKFSCNVTYYFNIFISYFYPHKKLKSTDLTMVNITDQKKDFKCYYLTASVL